MVLLDREEIFSLTIWLHQTVSLLLLCHLHCSLAALLLISFANIFAMTALQLHHIILLHVVQISCVRTQAN